MILTVGHVIVKAAGVCVCFRHLDNLLACVFLASGCARALALLACFVTRSISGSRRLARCRQLVELRVAHVQSAWRDALRVRVLFARASNELFAGVEYCAPFARSERVAGRVKFAREGSTCRMSGF